MLPKAGADHQHIGSIFTVMGSYGLYAKIFILDYACHFHLLPQDFLVRIFYYFFTTVGMDHFFKSEKLSRIVGIIAGGFSFTPYHKWHYQA